MVKYKCPTCGTLYDAVPVKCVICGAEFAPASQQDKPKSQPEPTPEVVAAAPVVEQAPVVEETPAPAPVEEPKVEEVKPEEPKEELKEEPKEEPKVEEPKEEKKEEKPEVKEEPKVEVKPAPVPQYDDASELNISSKKEKPRIRVRVIIGFVCAIMMIICLALSDTLPLLHGSAPEPRVYGSVIAAGAAFVFGVCALAFTGDTDNYKRLHAMAVAARILGVIFLVISCFNLVLWGTIGTLYFGSDTLSPSMGFDWKATVDNFFVTGQFALVKYVAPIR